MQAPHLEVVDGQGTHPPAFHRTCASGETSDGNRTNRRAPKSERAHCGRANGEGATRARLNLSCLTAIDLAVSHGAPRSWRRISERPVLQLSTHRGPEMPEVVIARIA